MNVRVVKMKNSAGKINTSIYNLHKPVVLVKSYLEDVHGYVNMQFNSFVSYALRI